MINIREKDENKEHENQQIIERSVRKVIIKAYRTHKLK